MDQNIETQLFRSIRKNVVSTDPHAVQKGAQHSDHHVVGKDDIDLTRESDMVRQDHSSAEAFRPGQLKARIVDADSTLHERERICPPGATSPFSAHYKMLRTQVLRRLAKLDANCVAVVSPTSGAGKTLTAINLAIAIAADPSRTALLVDLDLRSPSIAKRLGLEVKVGVDDCLLTRQPIHEALVRLRGFDRLSVLPARTRIENSSEVIGDARCGALINELCTRYTNRIVIIDLPPVLQADDVLAGLPFMRAGLMVIREGQTRSEDVIRAMDLLGDLKIVGTVLNGSRDALTQPY